MASAMHAYLVCNKCGGYGEQIPRTPYEEEKLIRALASTTKTRFPCPRCGGLLELLTPEDFYRKQSTSGVFEQNASRIGSGVTTNPSDIEDAKKKIKRACLLLLFIVISFAVFSYAISIDTSAGALILAALIIVQFYVFNRLKKNKPTRLCRTLNGAKPEGDKNFQEWRNHILSDRTNPNVTNLHHGGPCPFCGENRFKRWDSETFACIRCKSNFKIISDRTPDFFFCKGREAALEKIRRESMTIDREYDHTFPSESILISKHNE